VLCFTHGEASTLHGVGGDLNAVRAAELDCAGRVLGVERVVLLDHADGGLADVRDVALAAEAERTAREVSATLLLVFDEGGVTGHPDHQRATEAARVAGARLGLPVLAWTLPASVARTLNRELGTAFVGRPELDIDLVVDVDRTVQREAIECHRSQAIDNRVLRRRLKLLGSTERLRYLRA
jgi:LmbE family N-acetylglucosaminyl deacetylase